MLTVFIDDDGKPSEGVSDIRSARSDRKKKKKKSDLHMFLIKEADDEEDSDGSVNKDPDASN
jgi:hypothetical protein